MPTNPPSLNPDQLELYLQRVKYADHATPTGTNAHANPRLDQLRNSVKQDPLATLTELQRRHLGSITWGNTALGKYGSALLDPPFDLHSSCLCLRETRCPWPRWILHGKYQSAIRGPMLPGIPGVSDRRPRDPADEGYISLSHMNLIVTIAGQKYMIDVGFGRNTPTSPLPLQEHITATLISPGEMSLTKEPLAEFVGQTQRVWVYRARNDPQSPWHPQYSFSEVEFLLEDFAMINFFTSKSRSILFTQKLACTRVILDDEGLEPIGIYILAGRELRG
ncbi:arylamine N-acetyltransferase 1, partial [Aspergillus sclerotialis]